MRARAQDRVCLRLCVWEGECARVGLCVYMCVWLGEWALGDFIVWGQSMSVSLWFAGLCRARAPVPGHCEVLLTRGWGSSDGSSLRQRTIFSLSTPPHRSLANITIS